MLKLGVKEKKILDLLLVKKPKVVATDLGIEVKTVYNVVSYFRTKVQNAEEFLAVSKGRYRSILVRKMKTPKIVPDGNEENGEW